MTGRHYGPAIRRTALRLLAEGRSYPWVQDVTGATVRTLRRWALAAGLPARQENRLVTAEVLQLSERFGTRGAAEILGCSRGSVGYHRAKARRAGHGA